MSTLKNKLITVLLLASVIGTPTLANAADYSYTGGRGYTRYRTAPNLAPGIALGAIALAAIIAVAVQNTNNEHGHCHSN